MDEKTKKNLNKIEIMFFVAALISFLLVSLVLGKYMQYINREAEPVSSTEFYFSTNLTEDPKMVAVKDINNTWAYPGVENSNDWYLYGGTRHQIDIDVCNYLDDLRISNCDLDYDVSYGIYKAKLDEQGNLVRGSLGNVLHEEEIEAEDLVKTIKKSTGVEDTQGTIEFIDTETPNKDVWTLDIASTIDSPYEDNTLVEVYILSTKPYTEKITLRFILYTTDPQLSYRVIDHDTYYEMILMAEHDAKDVWLHWANDVSIDNTNELTYVYVNETGHFFQNEIMPDDEQENGYKMHLIHKFKTGESKSIYFFKTREQRENYETHAQQVQMRSYITNGICATHID